MKLILIILHIFLLPFMALSQSSSEEPKPSAAVSIIKSISDSFLPGAFEGIQNIIEKVKGKKDEDNEKLKEINSELGKLKSDAEQMRKLSISTLKDLKVHYEEESKDFQTINVLYNKVRLFSTKVSLLVSFSTILGDVDDIQFSSNAGTIKLINDFKDGIRILINNFQIDASKIVSHDKRLNSDFKKNKAIIDEIIIRIKGRNLEKINSSVMTDDEIKNFRKMAGSLNAGTYGFFELEKAVNEILWDLGSYLDDYLVNSEKITKKLSETISEMQKEDLKINK